MNRPIGNRQPANGKAKRLGDCLLPINSHATAIPFTVTRRRGTSVITLQLAESDLIIVGKIASRRLPENRLVRQIADAAALSAASFTGVCASNDAS